MTTCPEKAVIEAHRDVDMTIDGFSETDHQQTLCNDDCPGPRIEQRASLVRRVLHPILPNVIAADVSVVTCPIIGR